MQTARFVTRLFTVLITITAALSQAQIHSRLVAQPIDETKLVTLHGNVHPLAQARYALGAVSPDVPVRRLLVLLNRPPEQEAALARYMQDVHTIGSPTYHKWLTPQQFGERFGPDDSDVQAVSDWLNAKGFQVAGVSKAKTLIEFSGSVGQVNEAFHTRIHGYQVNDELHDANASDPQIPEALSGIVRGLSPLNDFHARPAIHVAGPAHLDPATNRITPEFTLTGQNGDFFGVGPEDFATQYDLAPLYAAGINGSGKTIGIINVSNVDMSRDEAYRSLFNLTSNPAQVVVDGGDPGMNDAAVESYLDIEAAGAVAPGATVNLYIAAADGINAPLILAAARAISDNQADVLSISFLECEANLGVSGNQILNSLWQQAAAQGQTVFVDTDDSGSAGCDNPNTQAEATQGLAVNGFATTPWNVAVGGTDFFYSDYAGGAPSAASHWNSTNDASKGSLKAPLPEQVWNNVFGFDVAPDNAFIVAGGGGVSTVYAKPSWQTGSGVPSDGQRDIPDVSLFAANGANLSGWVICVNPGDCTADSTGQIPVFIVGGTSASTPAMAGIMALVNQKHGRQGQANYVLYPLAKQMPTAFHDITIGGNNVPCVPASPDCVVGTGTTDKGLNTLSGYSAGTGYDLASGLGSIDADVLVSNWGNITFLPTITTLQLSSTTFTHGSPVTFTADVTHSAGSAAPSGNVSIETNSPVPFNQTQGILTLGGNGTGSSTLGTLPGGSYQVWASYPGDGVYSGGTSSPVSVTVMPEASSIGIASMANGQSFPSGGSTADGLPILLEVQPIGAASGLKTATGSVAFTFDSQPAVSVPLNVAGVASWVTPPAAAAGTHSVTASYSGDASYNASQSSAFSYTVRKGNTFLNIGPGGICGTGTTCTAIAGDTIPIEVTLELIGPQTTTAPVTVTLGSQSQLLALTEEGFFRERVLTGIAEFSNLAPGTYPLTATYNGDANYNAAPSGGPFSMVVAPASGARVPTTTVVTETSPVVQFPAGVNTIFTVSVTGGVGSNTPPTGSVTVYTNGLGVTSISLSPSGPNSSSGTGGPQIGQDFNIGQNQITAVYTGDSKYQESVSAPITLTAVQGGMTPDFTLAPAMSQFVVPKGSSANTAINLTSTFGFSGMVNLSCMPSDSSVSCAVSPAALSVSESAAGVATLMVTSTGANRSSGASLLSVGGQLWTATTSLMVGLLLWFTAGTAKRNPRALVALTVLSLLAVCMACGGGGQNGGKIVTPPPTPPTPLNAHSVVITGASNGVVHNAKIIVVVQ